MLQCRNLSQADLERIGAQVAEAFLAEEGCFSVLPMEVAQRMFTIIVETCYETGHLYTTSPAQEGFCVYWTKEERPGLMPQLRMVVKMLKSLPLKTGKVLMDGQNHWKPTEKRYKKQADYVEVFLLVVRREYQGQGYFRQMLEEPFALAAARDTICVLDTDAKGKAEKYCHVGMHVVESRVQRSGIEMFALER